MVQGRSLAALVGAPTTADQRLSPGRGSGPPPFPVVYLADDHYCSGATVPSACVIAALLTPTARASAALLG